MLEARVSVPPLLSRVTYMPSYRRERSRGAGPDWAAERILDKED